LGEIEMENLRNILEIIVEIKEKAKRKEKNPIKS
jgi:hypothetical protein